MRANQIYDNSKTILKMHDRILKCPTNRTCAEAFAKLQKYDDTLWAEDGEAAAREAYEASICGSTKVRTVVDVLLS